MNHYYIKFNTELNVAEMKAATAFPYDPVLEDMHEVSREFYESTDLSNIVLENNTLKVVNIPKPSPYYGWFNGGWTIPPSMVETIKSAKIVEVTEELYRRASLPILVDSILLDADSQSRDNISMAAASIKMQIDLQTSIDTNILFWRDANNTTHYWNTPSEYLAFLNAATVAITTRAAKLYKNSWDHKASISSITDAETILAYDITQNWDV